MKPQKYLKNAARAEQQKILENGSDLLAALEAQIPQKKKKRRVAVWLSVAASSLALIIAAVCIGVFAFREEETIYYDGNVVFAKSNLTELDDTCREFTVDPTSAKSYMISKAYDSPSGDPLYFMLTYSNLLGINMSISIVCNPNYSYSDFFHPLLLSREIDGYTLSYDLISSPNGAAFEIKGWGKINGARETVYITFSQISDREDDNAFFELIRTTIHKK